MIGCEILGCDSRTLPIAALEAAPMIYSAVDRGTQASCQESVSLLGEGCVIPEQGLTYKNHAPGLRSGSNPIARTAGAGLKRHASGEGGEKGETRSTQYWLHPSNLNPPASLRFGLRNMKIQLLVSTGILLVALLPCHECRALSKSVPAADTAAQQPDLLQVQPQSLPVLLRMGEEYFLRLGNLHKNAAAAASSPSSSSSGTSGGGNHHLAASAAAGNFFRAAVQQLQQLPPLPERSLEGAAEPWESRDDGAPLEAAEREKRSEEPPISLDLTFHLLREVLEMARAEQLAQQAHSNRKLMEIIGK